MKHEFTRQWIAKADSDLQAARHLMSGPTGLSPAVAFHAQQAVEKALKALLVWHQVEFSKTHDLGRLLDLVAGRQEDLSRRLEDVTELTPYAVEFRYPAEAPAPTRDEAERAVQQAERVFDAVVGSLPAAVRPTS